MPMRSRQLCWESASYTASEAMELNIADLIASDVTDLLAKASGRTVGSRRGIEGAGGGRAPDKEHWPQPAGALPGRRRRPQHRAPVAIDRRHWILIEFYSPGVFIPGVLGVVALALAFVALGNLPVNWTGLGLMALGLVLLFIELQAPGLSVPGALGVVTFLLGAFLLFGGFSPQPLDGPNFRVSIWTLVGVGSVMAIIMVLIVRATLASGRSPQPASQLGTEGMVGQEAVAASDLDPHGTVIAAGEEWSATVRPTGQVRRGETLSVRAVEGLTLIVSRPGDPEAMAVGPQVDHGEKGR